MTLAIYVLLVFVVTIADALRDRWISGYLLHVQNQYSLLGYLKLVFSGTDEECEACENYVRTRPWKWWRWHIAKWVAFYTPLGTITYIAMKYANLLWYEVVITATLMFFIWRKVYAKE